MLMIRDFFESDKLQKRISVTNIDLCSFFVLVAKTLLRLIEKVEREGDLTSLKITRHYLLFTGGCLNFAIANYWNSDNILEILNLFQESSWQANHVLTKHERRENSTMKGLSTIWGKWERELTISLPTKFDTWFEDGRACYYPRTIAVENSIFGPLKFVKF